MEQNALDDCVISLDDVHHKNSGNAIHQMSRKRREAKCGSQRELPAV